MDIQQSFEALRQYAIEKNRQIGKSVYYNTQIAALGYWGDRGVEMLDFHKYDSSLGEHSEAYFLRQCIVPYLKGCPYPYPNPSGGWNGKWLIYTRKMPCGPGQREGLRFKGGHDCMGTLIGSTTGLLDMKSEIWVGFEQPYAGWPGQNVRGQGATYQNMEYSWNRALAARCNSGSERHNTRFWDMRDGRWFAKYGMDSVVRTGGEINHVKLVTQPDGTVVPDYVIEQEN